MTEDDPRDLCSVPYVAPRSTEAEEAPEAAPCPACGGRGVIGARDEFGNWDGCEMCEGTGIDPDDPRSPL
jgi:DnaJ-class molecular chaperone